MFNVTVIKLRDIIKYILVALIVYIIIRFFATNFVFTNKIKEKINLVESKFVNYGINCQSLIIKTINNENKGKKEEDIKEENYKIFLELGANSFKIAKKGENVVEDKNKEEQIQEQAKNDIEEDSNNLVEDETEKIAEVKNVITEIVTRNGIKESFNREYNGVKIKNETDFDLEDKLLNYDNLKINTNNVIIFHTHTCESYTQSETYQYDGNR